MSPSQDIVRSFEDQRRDREGPSKPSQNPRIPLEITSKRGNIEVNAAGKRRQTSAVITSPRDKRRRVQEKSRQSHETIVISDDSDGDRNPGRANSLQTQQENASTRDKPREVGASMTPRRLELVPDSMGRNQSFDKPQSRQRASAATHQLIELSDDSDQEMFVEKDETRHSAKSGKFSMPRSDDKDGKKDMTKSHGAQKLSSLSRSRPSRRVVVESEDSEGDDEADSVKQVPPRLRNSTHENSTTDPNKGEKVLQSGRNSGSTTKNVSKARKPHRSNFEIENPEQFKRERQLQSNRYKGNTVDVPKVHPPLQDLGFDPLPKSELGKWMSRRDNVLRNLKKYVTPTPISRPVVYLQDLFDMPVINGRGFVCESIKPRQKPGRGAPKPLIQKGSFQIASFVNQSKKEESFNIELWDECSPNGSDEELQQVGDTMCLLLDRMPVQIQRWILPMKNVGKERYVFLEAYHKSAIVYTASRKLFSGYVCPLPIEFPISVLEGDACLGTDFRELVFRVWAKEISEDFPIPPCPKFLLFNENRNRVPTENAKVYDRGFCMLKSAIWQLFGAVGTVEALRRKFAEVTTLIGVERTQCFPGPYMGRPLWKRPTVSLERRAQFAMASIVKRDTTLSLRQDIFSIPGLSRTKAVLVFDVILQSWEQGSGLLNAWQAGMVVAHDYRQGKIQSVSFCSGTESDGGHGHVCSGCYHVWHCHDFDHSSGAPGYERICPRCIAKALDGRPIYDDTVRQVGELDALISLQLAAKKEVRPLSTNVGKKNAVLSIKTSLGKEKVLPLAKNPAPLSAGAISSPLQHLLSRLRGLLAGELRQFPALKAIQPTDGQVLAFLRQRVNAMAWKDAYAPSADRVVTVKSLPGRDPFQPSPDATFPYAAKEGRTALHILSNLSITAMYINFMKQQWLPGITGLVSESQALRHLSKKDPAWVNHMRRFDHQYGLTKQTAWARSGRLDKAVSVQRYESQKAEWVSGRCRKETIDLFQHEYSSHTKWRPDGHDRFEVIIAQMEEHFGRTVPRSKYGAPWIFIEEHLPEDWNWKWLWHTFKVRRVRMDIWCNKHWVTLDDVECLILECIFQWLKNDGRDTFLGLEMTLFARHPLCFVIAKKHHGRQMQSGWKCLEPTDFFEDYDESLCNLSIETQLSNYCKHNFDERYYGAILADLKDIPYSSAFYTRLPDPVPPITIRCLPEKAFRAIKQAQEDTGEEGDSEDEGNDISDDEEAEE